MNGLLAFLVIQLSLCWAKPFTGNTQKVDSLPLPDGNLHVYALPIGQGDSHVIQCPDGSLALYDMGSNEYTWDEPETESRFMLPEDIRGFFGEQQHLIRNIFITHNHYDHYVLLVRTFLQQGDLSGLDNIYMSCTEADLAWRIEEWISNMGFTDKVRLFNNGEACGPNGVACDSVNVCPGDADVTSYIMSANLGGHCSDGGNTNMDSIVLKIERAGTDILMMGDFEDETPDWAEEGQQQLMVEYYCAEIEATIYVLAHHGASYLANKPVLQNAVKPKAILASANVDYSYKHPRCSVIDGIIIYTGTLCKPSAPEEDEFYCGAHPYGDLVAEQTTQPIYECGLAGGDVSCPDERCLRESNDYALYTTTPDDQTIHLVHVSVDAQGLWGFTTHVSDSPANY